MGRQKNRKQEVPGAFGNNAAKMRAIKQQKERSRRDWIFRCLDAFKEETGGGFLTFDENGVAVVGKLSKDALDGLRNKIAYAKERGKGVAQVWEVVVDDDGVTVINTKTAARLKAQAGRNELQVDVESVGRLYFKKRLATFEAKNAQQVRGLRELARRYNWTVVINVNNEMIDDPCIWEETSGTFIISKPEREAA